MTPHTSGQGDLPGLLDRLTVAVTTLDAMGVDGYRDLYLYVVGTAGGDISRNLQVENEQLTVGPPTFHGGLPRVFDQEVDATRRTLLLAELFGLMKVWRWAPAKMARYLRCTETMFARWTGWSGCSEAPRLPRAIAERIRRLVVVDHVLSLQGVPEHDRPAWLAKARECFAGRSAETVLLGADRCEYAQLLMWALNTGRGANALH